MSDYTDRCVADGASVLWPLDSGGGLTDIVAGLPVGYVFGALDGSGIGRPPPGILVPGDLYRTLNLIWQGNYGAAMDWAASAGSFEFWSWRSTMDRWLLNKLGTHSYGVRLWHEGTVSLYVNTSAGALGTSAPTGTSVANVWEHWVGTWDGANARLYRNGVLVGGPTAAGGTMTNTAGVIRLGGDAEGIDGLVTGVAVYKVTLSAAQVAAHYAHGVRRRHRKTGGAWKNKAETIRIGGVHVDKPLRAKVGGAFV